MAALLLSRKPYCLGPKHSTLNQTRPHILAGDIEEMYSLFDHPNPADGLPYVVQNAHLDRTSLHDHCMNAREVKYYEPTLTWCVHRCMSTSSPSPSPLPSSSSSSVTIRCAICSGEHVAAKCPKLHGVCLACGHTGHPCCRCPAPLVRPKQSTLNLNLSHLFCSAPQRIQGSAANAECGSCRLGTSSCTAQKLALIVATGSLPTKSKWCSLQVSYWLKP